MATVSFVFTLGYVAEMSTKMLVFGSIVTVVTGDDQTTSALTEDGIDEFRQRLDDARQSAEKWHEFLECLSATKSRPMCQDKFPTVTIGDYE